MTDSRNDRKRPRRSLLSIAEEQRTRAQALFEEARKSGYRNAPPAGSRAINPLLRALAESEDQTAERRRFRSQHQDPDKDPQEAPAAGGTEALRPAFANDQQPSSHTLPARAQGPDTWRPLFDPTTVLAGVARSKSIIIALTISGAIIGSAVALSTPKEYASTAELLVDPRDLKLVDRELTQSGLPYDATLAIVENQVKILTSRSVLAKVVDELNLDRDPEFNGSLDSGIGRFFSAVKSIAVSDNTDRAARLRDALATEYLSENLDVERGGKTFVISVTMSTQNAEKSALIANKVVEVFLKTQGDFQSSTAARASGELNSRLEVLRARVEQAERKVEAFKSQNDLVDAQGRLITDDSIVRLNEQLSNAQAQTITLNARAASVRNIDVGQIVGGGLPEQVTSSVLTELRSQFASLKQEATQLAVKLGPRHPQLTAVNAQLDSAREEIQAELRRIVASIQVDLKRAVQQEQGLASQLAIMKARQAQVSEELVTLRELEREAAAQRAVYESFLLRARETDEQKDINTANISVISKASAALEPTGMPRRMIAAFGAALGFLAGIGVGVVRGAVQSLQDDRPGNHKRPGSNKGGSSPGRRPPEPETADPATGDDSTQQHENPDERTDPTAIAAMVSAAGDARQDRPDEPKLEDQPAEGEMNTTAMSEPVSETTQPENSEMNPAPQPVAMAPEQQQPAAVPTQPAPATPVQPAVAPAPQPYLAAAPAFAAAGAPAWQQPVAPAGPVPQFGAPTAYAQPVQPQAQTFAPAAYPVPAGHQAQVAAAHYPYQPVQPHAVHQMQPAPAPMPMIHPVPYPVPVPMPPAGFGEHPMDHRGTYSGSRYAAPSVHAHNNNRPVADRYADEPTQVEEIIDSLREFRDAVRSFSQERARRW